MFFHFVPGILASQLEILSMGQTYFETPSIRADEHKLYLVHKDDQETETYLQTCSTAVQ